MKPVNLEGITLKDEVKSTISPCDSFLFPLPFGVDSFFAFFEIFRLGRVDLTYSLSSSFSISLAFSLSLSKSILSFRKPFIASLKFSNATPVALLGPKTLSYASS